MLKTSIPPWAYTTRSALQSSAAFAFRVCPSAFRVCPSACWAHTSAYLVICWFKWHIWLLKPVHLSFGLTHLTSGLGFVHLIHLALHAFISDNSCIDQ